MQDDQRAAADRQRLTEVFRRHGDAVLAYVSARLDREDAQDLVAEVFTVAWRRLEAIREGQERPWLFGVARRLMMQHQRIRGTAAALQDRLRAYADRDDDHLGQVAAQRVDVLTALEALPEGDREVLLLRYWYDFSGRDAASVLGCSTATFAVRLHRAHRRFKAVHEEKPVAQQSPSAASLTAYMRGLQ
ncbi:RNA polymerase sigma factor [Micromonospora sp. DT48]|uniref:RNA polymerase sigma factor n=1 Tax=Micromonospora sp. DT48 TaxID=3393429 RepID=UPI003CE941B6